MTYQYYQKTIAMLRKIEIIRNNPLNMDMLCINRDSKFLNNDFCVTCVIPSGWETETN